MPFSYRSGRLGCGPKHVDLDHLLRDVGDAFYIYDLEGVRERARHLRHLATQNLGSKPVSIHYAMKANSNPDLLRALLDEGLGVDTVSGGEIAAALNIGFKAEQILFSGVGKSDRELRLALAIGVHQINVESLEELERIASLAEQEKCAAQIAVRLNPDVNPQTHPYIATGFRENKFGLLASVAKPLHGILAKHRRLQLRGVTVHIGSQLMDLDSLKEAIGKTLQSLEQWKSDGLEVERFDVGGGLGVDYDSADERADFSRIESYAVLVGTALANWKGVVQMEPGRILVARPGALVARIEYVKRTPERTFAVVNSGMHHLLRPALYSARHRIQTLVESSGPRQLYDVVGPICESADFLGKAVELGALREGDGLAVMDVGAYGYVMSSHYNLHRVPLEFIVQGARVRASRVS